MNHRSWDEKGFVRRTWAYGLIIVVVLMIYSSAVGFGLMWDDPRFYAGMHSLEGLGEVFASPSPPTSQYYRPLAVLHAQLLVSADGRVNAPLAHVLQIGAHLVNSICVAQVLRAFRLPRVGAQLAAVCFSALPLSYFAVAWQQNQQPIMLMLVLLALLAAVRYSQGRSGPWLAASLLSYALALLYQEGAVPFVVFFFWLARDSFGLRPRVQWPGAFPWNKWGWPLLHLGLVVLYLGLWVSMPLQRAITGKGLDFTVLAYLLQGTVFPVAALSAAWIKDWPPATMLALFAITWAALSWVVVRVASIRSAAFCWAWTAMGILPLWAGLSWDYAEIGSRLIYPSSLGVAGMWGSAAASIAGRGWRRVAGALVLAVVSSVTVVQGQVGSRAFEHGTEHLSRAAELLAAAPDRRLLFVNFPDRIEIRPRMYPLGFWGVILAPVVQDLSDYAASQAGHSAQSRSVASLLHGVDQRDQWPYRVDLRGVNAGPDELFEAARSVDAVYLTDYLPGGELRLRQVGRVDEPDGSASPVAVFGDRLQLLSAEAEQPTTGDPTVRLKLVWLPLDRLAEGDTVFVHLLARDGRLATGQDGDGLGGLLPLTSWAPGLTVHDWREVPLSGLSDGGYSLTVGVYNRVSGVRYPVVEADGMFDPTGELEVGRITVPAGRALWP